MVTNDFPQYEINVRDVLNYTTVAIFHIPSNSASASNLINQRYKSSEAEKASLGKSRIKSYEAKDTDKIL
jgi:hypothetical protein